MNPEASNLHVIAVCLVCLTSILLCCRVLYMRDKPSPKPRHKRYLLRAQRLSKRPYKWRNGPYKWRNVAKSINPKPKTSKDWYE